METLGKKYTIVRRLGIGGMAEVYLCRLRGIGGFDKLVVVKRIRTDIDQGEFTEMFLDEARVSANLTHPNIVHIFEIDEIENRPHIAMEYVRGPILSAVLHRLQQVQQAKQTERDLGHLAFIIAGTAAGIHYAHNARDADGNELGIVHRDISPNNIIVGVDGIAKVFDFGIAKARSNLALTGVGSIKGKISYMAPEQLRAHPIDHKADVYALGVCLFEATVGTRPFGGDSEAKVLGARIENALIPPSRIVDGYPSDLEQIVLAAMHSDPASRPNAADLAESLLAFAASRGSTTKKVAEWIVGLFPEYLTRSTTEIGLPEISVSGNGEVSPSSSTSSLSPLPALPTGLRQPHRGLVIGSSFLGAIAVAGVVYAIIGTQGPDSDDAATRTAHTVAPPAITPPPPPHLVKPPPVAAIAPPTTPAITPTTPAITAPEPPAPPRQGTLTLATASNADVFLDGSPIKHGSFSGFGVAAGQHALAIKVPGAPFVLRSISVVADRETRVEIKSAPAPHGATAKPPHPAVKEPTQPRIAAGQGSSSGSDSQPPVEPPVAAPIKVVVAEIPTIPKVDPPPAPPVATKPRIDVAATRAAVRSQVGSIMQCYERAKMDDSSLRGSVTARITVSVDGSVANVQISNSTLGSSQVERCIAHEISRWHLPKPNGDGPASFSYPFVFE